MHAEPAGSTLLCHYCGNEIKMQGAYYIKTEFYEYKK